MTEESAAKEETVETEATETETAETEVTETEVKETEEVERVPKFINDTHLTTELHVEANMIIGQQGRHVLLAMGLILLAIGAAIALHSILEYADYFDVAAIIFVTVGLTFAIGSNKKLTRKNLTKKLEGRNVVTRHVFYIDGFEFRSHAVIGTLTTERAAKGNFASFTAVKECKDFWILFYSKAEIDVIDKKGMKQGDAAELARFLSVRLGPKYKVCHK